MTSMPPIAVLVGGLARRMGRLTENLPKSMLKIAGKPFIAHQLELFQRERIRRVVLCTGHLSEIIEAFVGDGSQFGLQVSYSIERGRLLGTGGALRQALPLLGPEFLVIYGDSYLDIAFAPVIDAFRQSGATGLMTVFHNAGRLDTSNVEWDGNRILKYSKTPMPRMTYIDYGLAVLKASAFDDILPRQYFDLELTYQALVAAGNMAGYNVAHRFYEIGSVAGLAETEAFLRTKNAGAA
jgi:N-acetyl-alpha-D-muramate 1-phosphate uridylyltransferase